MKKLHDEEKYTEKLQYTAQYHENMENRVQIAFIDLIKNYAEAVDDTAAQEEGTSPQAQHPEGGNDADQNTPSHNEIADHGQNIILIQINRCKCDAKRRASPYKTEDGPAQPFRIRTHRD